MARWKKHACGTDGDETVIAGVQVWRHEWASTGEKAVIRPALFSPKRGFDIYEIRKETGPIRFAAAEVSFCRWLFFIESR